MYSPLFVRLGKFQGNLALATAAHAVEEKLAPMALAAGARAEVRVESLQYTLPSLEESRYRRAIVDRGAAGVMRRRR